MKKTLIIFGVIVVGLFVFAKFWVSSSEAPTLDSQTEQKPSVKNERSKEEVSEREPSPVSMDSVMNDVPFTSQAPLGQWNDSGFQDGCEEASVLMAMKWVKGESFGSSREASAEIADLNSFQKNRYGEFRDRSAFDTTQMIKDYFKYDKVKFEENISGEDIIRFLNQGSLVIVPLAGQKLSNPYFSPPGPERHMAVIVGYDKVKNEFIVNDPGTRRGEGFRYSVNTIESALKDYETGYHVPIKSVRKNGIVVSR